MTSLRLRRHVVRRMLVFVALIAASCSADDATDATVAAAAAPFDAVLIELFGTADTDEYLAQSERAAAELVVTCMAEAGFAFEIPPETPPFESPNPRDLAAAQTSGFGIIAGFRHQIANTDPAIQQGRDPNQDYVATLTAAEIERFFFTLNGPDPEPGQLRDGGCNSTAADEAYAGWKRFFDALPNFTSLGEERDTHPDWLIARATWRECMVGRGFDYAEPDAVRSDVISRMRDTVNEVYPGGRVPLIESNGTTAVDPQVDLLLEELVIFEQAAAVANADCTAPVAAQLDAVEQQVQQTFVDRHRSTIDELLAASIAG